MLKIAYLSSARIPSTAANSVQSIRMCEAFASLGHEVVLYARSGDERDPDLRRRFAIESPVTLVNIEQRGPRGLHTLAFLSDLRRLIGSRNPDLLFSRDVFMAAALAPTGLPLVFDAHHIPRPGSVQDFVFRRITRMGNIRAIIAITAALKAKLRVQYPHLGEEFVAVLPNGAADPFLRGDDPQPLGGPGLKIGYVGHLYEGRGVDQILAAARRFPDMAFHLIGGREEDLRRWAGALSNVWMHGHVPHGDLGTYYRSLDILVAPYGAKVMDAQGRDSAAVASPMKIFEYMAAGKPIISTSLPGVLEVLTDGVAGLVVPPDDVEAFCGALARLAADDALRIRLGAAARSQYLACHSWTARARAAIALYRSVGAG